MRQGRIIERIHMQAYFNRTKRTQNSGQKTATTTDKQQLKHRGLYTQANKLNKITRGRG